MSINNDKRRIRRLPLYVAMLTALPLGGMQGLALAEDINDVNCTADVTDKACKESSLTPESYVGIQSPIGINAGGFNGSGNGISIGVAGETAASASAVADIAIGVGAVANSGGTSTGTVAIAIGQGAHATADTSIALGGGASASAANTVALGSSSVADTANTVSVGDAGSDLYRQIVNMAAGTQANDAVNVSQLQSVVANIGGSIDATTGAVTMPTFTVQGDSTISTVSGAVTALDGTISTTNTNLTNLQTQISTGAIGLVQQAAAGDPITVAAGKAGTVVDFTGLDGARTLTGVSRGTLSEDSTDAVNGAQLFETNGNVAANTVNITNLTTQIDNLSSGATGLVQQDAITGAITVAAGTGGAVVDFTNGAGDARTIAGVAAGTVAVGSTEAVNGAQLYAVNQQVVALGDRVTTAEGDIVNIKDTLANLGAGVAAGIAYDDPASKDRVTFGGAAGTLLTNVAAGAVATGSTDAINGGQLSAIQDNLQSQIGNINDRMDAISDGLGGAGNFDGDMENERITNLAPGIEDTDAANLGQVKEAAANAVSTANAYTDAKFDVLNADLQNFKGEVSDRFNRVDQRIDRVGAMSAASTQMAIGAGGVLPGEGRAAAGVGFQNNRSALAVGYAQGVNDRVRVSVGAVFSGSESNYGAGVGVSLFKR